MRDQKYFPLGLLTLLLCTSLAAEEQQYDPSDPAVSDAVNTCEYWAAIEEVAADERTEYLENCISEELASYEAYPLSMDSTENYDAPAVSQ